MNNKTKKIRGIICTLSGGIAWGFSGACGQILLQQEHIDSSVITLFRMLFAGIILSLINIAHKKKKAFSIFSDKKSVIRLILFAIFGITLSQFTYLKAIFYSNAGTATVLQYLGPVMIMICVCFMSRRFPDLFELISIILAVGGVTVLATHGDFSSLKISEECLFWGIASAVGLTLYSLLPKALIVKYGSVEITGYAMLIGAVFMTVLIRPWEYPLHLNVNSLLALSGMVIIGTALAYTLYLQGVNDIGTIKASMLACIEPVSATLFSCFWLKNSFAPVDLIGFAMILSTVFILSRDKN